MFFESRGSLIAAAILIVAGCVSIVSSIKFADAASREASTVGVITYISGGKAHFYVFRFVVNGHQEVASSASCTTLLSSNGCAVGKPIRVYYDPSKIVAASLQEYGDRASGSLFLGVFFILGGVLVTVFHFVFSKMDRDSDGDDVPDAPDSGEDAPLHVTPDA